MTRPGIEPRSPGPLANTLTPRPKVSVFNGSKSCHVGCEGTEGCK